MKFKRRKNRNELLKHPVYSECHARPHLQLDMEDSDTFATRGRGREKIARFLIVFVRWVFKSYFLYTKSSRKFTEDSLEKKENERRPRVTE